MSKLKTIILVGTSKDASETSNTLISSQFLVKYFSGYDTECEIVRLAVHDIKSGTYTNVYRLT